MDSQELLQLADILLDQLSDKLSDYDPNYPVEEVTLDDLIDFQLACEVE